jgi:hypothetical protein
MGFKFVGFLDLTAFKKLSNLHKLNLNNQIWNLKQYNITLSSQNLRFKDKHTNKHTK